MPSPRVWIAPFSEVESFKRTYAGRVIVSRAAVLAEAVGCENAWHLIEGWQPWDPWRITDIA